MVYFVKKLCFVSVVSKGHSSTQPKANSGLLDLSPHLNMDLDSIESGFDENALFSSTQLSDMVAVQFSDVSDEFSSNPTPLKAENVNSQSSIRPQLYIPVASDNSNNVGDFAKAEPIDYGHAGVDVASNVGQNVGQI